jgi:hypothetical protein
VTDTQTEAAVGVVTGEMVGGEDLLARVLDDDTVTALAEQARGQGVALLGEGGAVATADQAVPGGRVGR